MTDIKHKMELRRNTLQEKEIEKWGRKLKAGHTSAKWVLSEKLHQDVDYSPNDAEGSPHP